MPLLSDDLARGGARSAEREGGSKLSASRMIKAVASLSYTMLLLLENRRSPFHASSLPAALPGVEEALLNVRAAADGGDADADNAVTGDTVSVTKVGDEDGYGIEPCESPNWRQCIAKAKARIGGRGCCCCCCSPLLFLLLARELREPGGCGNSVDDIVDDAAVTEAGISVALLMFVGAEAVVVAVADECHDGRLLGSDRDVIQGGS